MHVEMLEQVQALDYVSLVHSIEIRDKSNPNDE
jgi:hypothetical protein